MKHREGPNHLALHNASRQVPYQIHLFLPPTGRVRCSNNLQCNSIYRAPRFESSKQSRSERRGRAWFLGLCEEGFDRCASQRPQRQERGLHDDNFESKEITFGQ